MQSIHRPSSSLLLAHAFAAFASIAACGKSAPATSTIVDGAIVAQVSADQSYLAYYLQPTRLPNGPYSGSLEVKPLLGGATITLGAGAYDANFEDSNEVLYFFERPAIDPTTQLYTGSLSVWTPKLNAPVAVSSGYVPRSVTTSAHSATLFLDTPQPDETAAGDVKLLRTGECAGTTCPVQTLATGVALSATRMSFDGTYAAYEVVTQVGALQGRDVFLVSVADGTTTQVSTTTIPSQVVSSQRLSDLSPDGSLLATVTTVDGAALQLQVIATATGAPVAWGALPAGSLCTGVQFADSANLVASVLDPQGTASLYLTTPASASFLQNATQFFLVQTLPGSARYVFFSTTAASALAAGAPFDLGMLDLASPTRAPLPLAASTRVVPRLSRDRSMLWLLDHYDAATGIGALVTASLPSGALSGVSPAVYAGSVNFGGGTDHLFYSPVGSLASSVSNGIGAALRVSSVGTSWEVDPDCLRWDTAGNPPTIYVSTDNPLRLYTEVLP